MDTNLIIPPQDNLYMILDTKELVKSLNNIHADLCDIQATIREQNDLLDELVHPHKALFNEENDCLCEFEKEESNKPCEM